MSLCLFLFRSQFFSMSVNQKAKCMQCREYFEVTFSLEEVQSGQLPMPPDFCPVCSGDSQAQAAPPDENCTVSNADLAYGIACTATADGLLYLKCHDCDTELRLGFQVESLLQNTLPQGGWRCSACRGTKKVAPFVFEEAATAILPAPYQTSGPAAVPLEVPQDAPDAGGVYDTIFQVDCDGNPLA